MKTWALQDAKNKFSHLVDLVIKEGPQMVTKHGQPAVVLVAAEEYKRMERPKETVLEFFAPLRGSGIKLVRRKDMPRTAT